MEVEKYLVENQQCYNRFKFDKIFRFLLSNDFSNEEAKDVILFNCTLSALVFQERIHNGYYKRIAVNEGISSDLLELKNEIFNQMLVKFRAN